MQRAYSKSNWSVSLLLSVASHRLRIKRYARLSLPFFHSPCIPQCQYTVQPLVFLLSTCSQRKKQSQRQTSLFTRILPHSPTKSKKAKFSFTRSLTTFQGERHYLLPFTKLFGHPPASSANNKKHIEASELPFLDFLS